MKRHSLPPGARALVAFIGTVVLAVLAAVSLLMPDVAVQSVDSMSNGLTGLDQILSTSFLDHWAPEPAGIVGAAMGRVWRLRRTQ